MNPGNVITIYIYASIAPRRSDCAHTPFNCWLIVGCADAENDFADASCTPIHSRESDCAPVRELILEDSVRLLFFSLVLFCFRTTDM